MEVPGTAPGSEWFITTAIYRHSQPEADRSNIAYLQLKKRLGLKLGVRFVWQFGPVTSKWQGRGAALCWAAMDIC